MKDQYIKPGSIPASLVSILNCLLIQKLSSGSIYLLISSLKLFKISPPKKKIHKRFQAQPINKSESHHKAIM